MTKTQQKLTNNKRFYNKKKQLNLFSSSILHNTLMNDE